MSVSKKTKPELISEIEKLQREIELLKQKKTSTRGVKKNSLLKNDSEERYLDILENASDLIHSVNSKGQILLVNKAWKNTLGYSDKEIRERTIFDFIHPDSLHDYLKLFAQLMKGQNAEKAEISFLSKQGTPIKCEGNVSCKMENGQLVSTRSIFRDITVSHQALKQIKESEANYRVVYNQAFIGIAKLDLAGNFIQINEHMCSIFGYSKEEFLKKTFIDITFPEDRYIDYKKKLLEEKAENLTFEKKYIHKSGLAVYTNVSISIVGNPKKRGSYFVAAFQDITERVKAEKEIKQTNAFLNSIIENIPNMIFVKDAKNLRYVRLNKAFEDLTGYKTSELIGKGDYDFFPKSQADFFTFKDKEVLKRNSPLDIPEEPIATKTGRLLLHTKKITINDENGQPLYLLGISEDITERKRNEEKIQSQSAKLNAVFESGSHIIWTINKTHCLTYFNKNFKHFIKRQYDFEVEDEMSMLRNDFFYNEEYKNLWIKKYNMALIGIPQHFEAPFIDKAENIVWNEIFLNPIFDMNSKVIEVSGIGHDITEKKNSEEKIRQSLQEKEVLLKEVHHRVKNNLQVISSILNLQSSYVKDQGTLNILKESQNRIKSMAFIHETLYQTVDFSKINFSEYVENLSRTLMHSYNLDSEVKLNLDIQNVFLNLDVAIPCGLIINELISNALKYAFPDKKKECVIEIKMNEENNIVKLLIGDNGIGLPKHIDYRNTESLGLQLVITLIEQLDGTIKLNNSKGTNYTVIFKQNQA